MEKKRRGRPSKKTFPEPIPDTVENISRALFSSPPKKKDEWEYMKEDKRNMDNSNK